MINVVVTYTVPKDFVAQNEQNISNFLRDFEKLDQSKFSYRILKGGENKFIHISKYADEVIQKELLNVPSFIEFQKQRDASSENIQQNIEILNFVGSSGMY